MIAFTPLPVDLDGGNEEESEASTVPVIVKYTCLLINPILMALGQVMTRKMRKLNENVVSCYMNALAIPVMIGLCYATGGDMSAWCDFDAMQWVCIVVLSVTVIISQTFRFMAFQNEQAAKLQPLSFLSPVYHIIFDLTIFAAVFNIWQIIGMIIVCLVFFVELIFKFCFHSKPNDDDKFKRADEITEKSKEQ